MSFESLTASMRVFPATAYDSIPQHVVLSNSYRQSYLEVKRLEQENIC
jgi:hypothetical protein